MNNMKTQRSKGAAWAKERNLPPLASTLMPSLKDSAEVQILQPWISMNPRCYFILTESTFRIGQHDAEGVL